jgi:hypothetical protein
MQTLFQDEKKRSLLRSGLSMVADNKRYIFWFWLLNVVLAWMGATMFRDSAHAILDHSLYAGGLVRGFDVSVLIELFMRPEFPSLSALSLTSAHFAFLFFLLTTLFLPGVFAGYASNYRLPREDFFRACGRNLWRFIRILIIAGIVMGIVAGILFAANGAIVKKAGESTYEVLPFGLHMIGLAIIFLVMTILRIWFDLAEVNTVLSDQRAVRKSIASGFRHTFRSLGSLLGNYVLIAIVAAAILVAGLWIWIRFVSPQNIIGAVVVSQLTLFFLLVPRFWQRGVAVTYWKQEMDIPVVAVQPVIVEPLMSPSIPPAVSTPPATAGD